MTTFKKVEITDKTWINELLTLGNHRGCHLNFTNLFAWDHINNYQAARYEDLLLVKGSNKQILNYYYYPVGQGNVRAALDFLQEDAKANKQEIILLGLNKAQAAELESFYPLQFEVQFDRDACDYIYLLDKMVTLSGKKLQAKRNHINRFIDNPDWSFEILGPDNMAECWQMNKEWCRLNDCQEDQELANEACAVRRCFNNYYTLGLEGGVLRREGKIVAFTMADRLNSDTFDIHIEKAFSDIQGAYQMINREFAAYLQKKYPDIVYVNREEDMGFEGLRKAKLSYQPAFLEEKYWAKRTGSD
jgi:hypothetical protein